MSQILESVQSKYGAVAESTLSSNHKGVMAIAEAFGYTAEELTFIPAEANMGLSCGNPTATARLRPGEVVVDLGSGGGLDVFLASKVNCLRPSRGAWPPMSAASPGQSAWTTTAPACPLPDSSS
jgi:hypothetical protein